MLRIKRVEIEKQAALDEPVRHDFTYLGRGYQYFARIFNIEQKRMLGVVLHQYRNGHLVARLDAESAEWRVDGAWEFHDGYYRTFEGGQEHAERFRSRRLPDLYETPEDLARLEPEPDAMNYSQLRRYVEKMRASGGRVDKYLVRLYTKISDPFTNLVMAVLGIGLAASKRKLSLSAGFGITITIAFLYLSITNVASALGQNETIPPPVAAWIGPILFALAGAALLARADR
jgi:lipopolysaccharide export system permease protein